MATIIDVADAAGVSTATVSRVVNKNPKVDPELAARVHKAISELGYHPSRVARSLRTRQSRVWAVVISDIRNPFFTEMVRGIEDAAYASGYSIVLCNADEDEAKEASYLRFAIAEHVSGIVLAPAQLGGRSLKSVLERGIPVVTVDRRLDNYELDHVVVDNIAGAEQAVVHLIERGYEQIAMIGGSPLTTTGVERLAGYHRGLDRCGRRADPRLVRTGDFREASGYQAMQSLLELRTRPDAVFVANNLMTIGALRALREAGVPVPEEIGMVGFDDAPWAPLLHPPLTAVAQPIYDLGSETARLLLSRLNGYNGGPRQVILSPSLEVRASSTPKVVSSLRCQAPAGG
ncbi:MAG: LacI family DNA-binding transcriptional regulator [Acidimicrobiales bacterium]